MTEQTDTGTPLRPQATVLCVDDEQNILTALRRLLRPAGYNVLLATSGAEGLRILEQQTVDVVVSDMRMPQMSGAQFLQQVADRWPDTMRILLTGYADMDSTIEAINKGSIYQYLSKPWDDDDFRIILRHALEKRELEAERRRLLALTERQNAELRELNAGLEQKVQARTAELSQTMGMLEAAHESLKKSYVATVRVFSNLVELREGDAGAGHSRRVAEGAHRMALGLGMSKEDAQQVLFAALLHDIGKIGLPDRLLRVPYNAMDAQDRADVERHPVVGEALLMTLQPLETAARLIRSHHEHYDGHGYPDRLEGEDIPLGARILAVANDYDALQHGTLMTDRLSGREAGEYIARHRGTRYDPRVVTAFLGEAARPTAPQRGVMERRVGSEDLLPGMVVARDLVTRSGILYLSKGYVLDAGLIRKLQEFERSLKERQEIYVVVGERSATPQIMRRAAR